MKKKEAKKKIEVNEEDLSSASGGVFGKQVSITDKQLKAGPVVVTISVGGNKPFDKT